MKLCFASLTLCCLLLTASPVRADYPPYRYAPVGTNMVVLVPRDGGACGSCGNSHGCLSDRGCLSKHGLFGHHGHRGSSGGGGGLRMEYAPYRYQPAGRMLQVPPGIAGQVANGSLQEYRFIDLQPRYQYNAQGQLIEMP